MGDKEKCEKLAREVLNYSRNMLLVNLRFLDYAFHQLKLVCAGDSIAVDGKNIYYNPLWLLKRYKEEKKVVMRDYLHMVFHCIFHHFLIGGSFEQQKWDLACDIAVENTINDLDISCVNSQRSALQAKYISDLLKELNIITAEKVYYYLKNKEYSHEELECMSKAFSVDDHSIWYNYSERISQLMNDISSNKDKNKKEDENSEKNTKEQSESTRLSDNNNSSDFDINSKSELESIWKDIAQRMKTDQNKILRLINSLNNLKSSILDCDNGAKAFDVAKNTFNQMTMDLKKNSNSVGEHLNNAFKYLEEVFGEGQEILIFVTELTINYYCSQFISHFGCKEYFKHNKDLLFYDRQREIISELENLEI